MPRRASTLLVLLLLTSGCNGDDPVAPEDPGFELEVKNRIEQVGDDSQFTPLFRLLAVDPARSKPGEVQEIIVTWPDGSTTTSMPPEFDLVDGFLVAAGTDPDHPAPLPSGVYAVSIRRDAGTSVELESEHQIEVLPPITDPVLETGADVVTASWVAPQPQHRYRVELYRFVEQDGSQVREEVSEVTGGAAGSPTVFQVLGLDEIEPGAPFAVRIVVEDEHNVRFVELTDTRPAAVAP